jgi:hypothetical protein
MIRLLLMHLKKNGWKIIMDNKILVKVGNLLYLFYIYIYM